MITDDTRTNAELVKAGQSGDKEALRILLERNWLLLKGMVCSVLRDTNDVDDALQDTCVQVISKIDTLKSPDRVKGWLAVIAKRQALALRKKFNRSALVSDIESFGNQFEKSDDPAERVIDTEQYKEILEAITVLPEKYRQVFTLRHMSDLSYKNIAETLDMPMTTVQIRLVRARQMIKDKLMKKEKCRITGT